MVLLDVIIAIVVSYKSVTQSLNFIMIIPTAVQFLKYIVWVNRPFHRFFQLLTETTVSDNLSETTLKRESKNSVIARFERDLLKKSDDIARQSRKMFQTCLRWVT